MGTFDAEKADMWAAGLSLLQIFYNKGPLELFQLPHRLEARVEKCNTEYFAAKLKQFEQGERGSILWVIMGLLGTNQKTRLNAQEALQARCFRELDQTMQEEIFEQLRRETFAQHEGIEADQVHLGDYEWARKRAPEEERAQDYQSASNQQFYGYALTPDFASEGYRFSPDQVAAGSSASSSGYQLTPGHVTADSSSSSGYQLTP